MTPMQQYQQYTTSKILTASPAELTLMLYDGAIKFCNIAQMAIEKKDMAKAHTYIVKVERIIDEFRQTLDPKYEVSKEFERIYSYLSTRLIEANVHKDAEILEEVKGHLKTTRETWKKIMEINKVGMPPSKPVAVNQ
ncbi:MAG: flagellar export chaperone FliS [Lachnospiraceae bacterium]|nr:flagellar export chaperone FliS [Lachnospiraceae bacterium]